MKASNFTEVNEMTLDPKPRFDNVFFEWVAKMEGVSNMVDPWITTYSGRQFFLLRATVNDIYIEDIAHGLSNVCRYSGQCRKNYSVAQHSVLMAQRAPTGPLIKLQALLHDAPEAYIGDMITPLKAMLPEYIKVQNYLEGVIFSKFGCSWQSNYEVDTIHALDRDIREPEVRSLFRKHDGWVFGHSAPLFGARIRPWSHKKAEREFLKMFRSLRRIRSRAEVVGIALPLTRSFKE
jgi:hypothetical protein